MHGRERHRPCVDDGRTLERWSGSKSGVKLLTETIMEREKQEAIVCYKDGEEMQEVSATEIPAPAGRGSSLFQSKNEPGEAPGTVMEEAPFGFRF